MADDDMVWVDDGMGPVVAAWSKDQWSKTQWIREPKQMPRSKFDPVFMKILSEKELAHYRKCIENAGKNKSSGNKK